MKKLLIFLVCIAVLQVRGQVFINSHIVNTYDVDAIAGFEAAGISDPVKRAAANAFIVSCKARGNWTGMKGLWLLAGSTSTSQAINWKSPGTYDLSFTGTSHSSAGMQGDGTTNVVDTGIVPSSTLTTGAQVGFYTSTTSFSATAVADMGLFQGSNFLELGVYGASPNIAPHGAVFGTAVIDASAFASPSGPLGFWYAINVSSGGNYIYIYRDAALVAGYASTLALPSGLTGTIKLTCRSNNSGTVSRRSSKMYGFFFVGDGLSDLPGLSTDVLALMTAFGR